MEHQTVLGPWDSSRSLVSVTWQDNKLPLPRSPADTLDNVKYLWSRDDAVSECPKSLIDGAGDNTGPAGLGVPLLREIDPGA